MSEKLKFLPIEFHQNYFFLLLFKEFIQHFSAFEQNLEDESIDGCFYGISTIFFRNLANSLIDNSELKSAVYDQENLQIWEKECNSNEVVIQELSRGLQIHIKLVFFDQGSFHFKDYSEEMPQEILLLIKPGHYNIGYKIENQQRYQIQLKQNYYILWLIAQENQRTDELKKVISEKYISFNDENCYCNYLLIIFDRI